MLQALFLHLCCCAQLHCILCGMPVVSCMGKLPVSLTVPMLPQQGQGIARQRQAIVNGLKDSVMVCLAAPHATFAMLQQESWCSLLVILSLAVQALTASLSISATLLEHHCRWFRRQSFYAGL